jgi:hypothetical protein
MSSWRSSGDRRLPTLPRTRLPFGPLSGFNSEQRSLTRRTSLRGRPCWAAVSTTQSAPNVRACRRNGGRPDRTSGYRE